MAITMDMAERALKSIYLDRIRECINNMNPLWARIKQTSNDVWGKEIIREAPVTGDSPLLLKSRIKSLCLTIDIAEATIIKNLWKNPAAMVDDTIGEIMNHRDAISEMLYGDGTQQAKGLTGLAEIFDISKSIYGSERHPLLMPYINKAQQLTDVVIEQAIDELSDRGATVDFIAISKDVKYAYMAQHKNIDIIELNGGFKAMSYNGIPIVYDKYIPKGTMYLLDTSAFALYQLCDWNWLETDNGKILRQSKRAAIYEATLVKYADLICDYPYRQGMIKFTEI